MDTSKHNEFFSPMEVDDDIHVVGLGATGSHIAEQLARLGLTHIHLWDYDTVDLHNISNQMYNESDIGLTKVQATVAALQRINSGIKLYMEGKYEDHKLSGFVFMCADSMECRKNIIKYNKDNLRMRFVFDFRLRLEDAQHYAANWYRDKEIKALEASMDFTDEEAREATPVSGCGTALAIIPTIKCITAIGIANFINIIKSCPYKTMVIMNPFTQEIVSFDPVK